MQNVSYATNLPCRVCYSVRVQRQRATKRATHHGKATTKHVRRDLF